MRRLLMAALALAFLGGGLAVALSTETRAEINANGQHWATGDVPTRLGVMVQSGVNLDRQLIANVVEEYDKQLPALEVGVVADIPTEQMCAQPQAQERPYGFIVVCRWAFGSGGGESYSACNYEAYAGCEEHYGFWRISLPAPNYPYYPRMICHELGHALGLDHGGNGCMTTFSWVQRNLGYCPGSEDIADLNGLYAHNDGVAPAYNVGPFTETGEDYGCPAPPYYDDGSGQQYTPTPTATPAPPTPTATVTPTFFPSPTPCLPPTAKRCR